MKKNISINISGIIFHIEEDGYENLRKYLDSINKYFSSFDDSSEILADIESRIAEIFLSKLNEGKQVITAEDVNSLITTMGSVSDFKAAEEQDFSHSEESSTADGASQQTSGGQNTKSYLPPKQLRRDQKRKILGGVCSGLGSYLNVDPVWIRLLFAILTFAYGITLCVYIVMWIVVPGSYDLDEPEITKKMYRDPEHKVIAGVSGGVASFLNIDIIAVRILFIALTIAGGLGFLIYVVLWAILPEAKTLTDKLQMQGEPVTLSNIESNIKKNQNIAGNEEETQLTKILLFPFRLIGMIITALAKVIMPLIEVIRVAAGILVTLVGLSMVFVLVVVGGVLVGLFSGMTFPGPSDLGLTEIGFPIEIFSGTFPPITTLAVFLVAIIPCIFILMMGISIIGKRVVFNGAMGWVLFTLFLGSLAVVGVTAPRIIHSFKENGEYKIENSYVPTGKTLILKVNETELENYHAVNLTLKGYDSKEIKLVQTFESQGSSRQNAIENARMVDYHVDFKDSILTFDNSIQFKKDAKFRAQHVYMTLYIPYDFPFVLDEQVSRFVSHYIDHENLGDNTWKMTAKGLTCITCPKHTDENSDNEREFDLSDFNAVDINGVVDVTINRGDHYAVDVIGSESKKEKYDIYKRDNTLVINFENGDRSFWKGKFDWSEIKINITMPELEKLEVKGAGKVNFSDFKSENMDIDILGAMNVRGELHVQNLTVNVTGASKLELQGDSKNMEANIQGASSLNAYRLEVIDADVEVIGASHANVNVTGTLEMTEGIASNIEHHGHPTIIKHD